VTFRIEVCATTTGFGEEVIRQIRHAAADAGADALTEVKHHTHLTRGPVMALVVASNGPPNDQMVSCTRQAIAAEQIVIPAIDDVLAWNGKFPPELQTLNAVDMSKNAGGRQILEAAGVLTPLRGVFLSHRRSDGSALAMQLASELRKFGIGTFVDVLDILPAKPVQDRILGALDDMACLVLLESPDALGSEWVGKEVVYAQERHLGILSLCWAAENPNDPRTLFPQFDSGNRIDVLEYLEGVRPSVTLTQDGIKIAVKSILHEFTQALYFRRLNLERELMAAFPDLERMKPWLFALRGPKHSRLIGLAPYRPGALDLHTIAIAREAEQIRDAILVHHPITADAVEARMLAWLGGKGPELALGIDEIADLAKNLDRA